MDIILSEQFSGIRDVLTKMQRLDTARHDFVYRFIFLHSHLLYAVYVMNMGLLAAHALMNINYS